MDHVKMFAEEYGPIAVQVSKQTGIAPSVLLAQWGLETNYGRSVPGQFNFGNIKDLSGTGTEAVDNKTKTKDRYINFESPEAFGDYYAHLIKRLYPNALNTGADVDKLAEGLRTGVRGAYAEDEGYDAALKDAYQITSRFYSDPKELPTVRPLTQAEQIAAEREGKEPEAAIAPVSKELVDPAVAATLGAATSILGQVPFQPKLPSKIDPSKAIEKYEAARDATELAKAKLGSSIPGSSSYASLQQEYQLARDSLEKAKNEYILAEKMSKIAPPPAVAPTVAPSAAPTEAGLIPSAEQHQRGFQGTTKETGITGRASQTTYQARTQEIAEQAERQRKAAQALVKSGVLTGEMPDLTKFGGAASTPAGVLAPSSAVKMMQNEQDLQRIVEEARIAQEKRQAEMELDRLRQQRAAAGQRLQLASSALTPAESAQSGLAKAETNEELARRQLERAKATPGALMRPLETTGAKVGRSGALTRGAIGGIGGYQAATGANALAGMDLNKLIERWAAGDRSPELQQALIEAANAAGRTGAGVAAAVPAMGKGTARLKGAGVLGTLGLGAIQAMRALQEPSSVPSGERQ